MNTKYFKLYCLMIALLVTVPLLCTMINLGSGKTIIKEPELNGVSAVPEKPEFSWAALQSGRFQSDFEDWFTYNLISRRVQTKVYNQLLYSLFDSTDNATLLVGQDDYLFDRALPAAYLTEVTPEYRAAMQENIAKLARLTDLLAERGVPLVVRMSPSKAEYYPEYLPESYSRFVRMKQDGQYAPNWYQVFCEEIKKTDIPYYDRHALLVQMQENGDTVFAKGGDHWTLAPMAEYVNGLNECIENLTGRKLGRMVVDNSQVLTGTMGVPDDSDLWAICWNAVSAEPDYPSPIISYSTTPSDAPFRVFTVGQSFTTIMLEAIYSTESPVWDETYFSWYDSRVIKYPSDVAWGTQVSDSTDDYAQYLSMDVILVDFVECGDGATQFEFVDHMLQYLSENEVTS